MDEFNKSYRFRIVYGDCDSFFFVPVEKEDVQEGDKTFEEMQEMLKKRKEEYNSRFVKLEFEHAIIPEKTLLKEEFNNDDVIMNYLMKNLRFYDNKSTVSVIEFVMSEQDEMALNVTVGQLRKFYSKYYIAKRSPECHIHLCNDRHT